MAIKKYIVSLAYAFLCAVVMWAINFTVNHAAFNTLTFVIAACGSVGGMLIYTNLLKRVK